jgi:hypothetical protein
MKRMEAFLSVAGTIHKTKDKAAGADIAALLGCTESLSRRIVEQRAAIIEALRQVDEFDFQIPMYNPGDDPAPEVINEPPPEQKPTTVVINHWDLQS